MEDSDPTLARFEVALFGFKGNALFVYLAQPNGLEKAVAERNIGPKARPFVRPTYPLQQTVGPSALACP